MPAVVQTESDASAGRPRIDDEIDGAAVSVIENASAALRCSPLLIQHEP